MKVQLAFSVLILAFSIAILGCKKDEKEDPPAPPDPCESVNSAFQAEVLPIFQASCGVSGCHDDFAAEGGLVFTDYQTIKASVQNDQNQLIESINFQGGSTDWMPRDTPGENATADQKLPQSQIDKIECWIARGMPND